MMLSLRTKLVILLLASGAGPLLAALGFMLYEGHALKSGEVGHQYLSNAVARADAMKWALHEEVVVIVALARNPYTLAEAARANAEPYDAEAAARIDEAWMARAEPLPHLKAAMEHGLGEAARLLMRGGRRRELFFTDRDGRVFATAAPTTDYLQADEDWWRQVFNGGSSRVYVGPVEFDRSAGGWSVDVCVPLLDEKGRFLGVCKAVVDLGNWVASVGGLRDEGVSQVLVDEAGRVVHDGVHEPLQAMAGRLPRGASGPGGDWVLDGDMLLAAAPVTLGEEIEGLPLRSPTWRLLLRVDAESAMAMVRGVVRVIAVVGGVCIAAAFLVGLIGVQGQVIRPLRRLRSAATLIADGELDHRIDPNEGVAASRELRQLVDDFNRMAEAVQRSHDEIEMASEMKSRFVQVAGHELKTPLTYILAMSAMLADRGGDERGVTAARSIEQRARRLDEIVTGMLKLSQDPSGLPLLDRKPCDLDELLTRLEREVLPFIAQRGQQLKVYRPTRPQRFPCDAGKIFDAVLNLLTNAVKFTPDGGIVSLAGERIDADTIRIAVSDQGCGIPAEEMEHIFEPFWGGAQVLQHSSGEFGFQKRGAGLGLPVAKYFTELHGGRIEVHSTPAGCVFTVLLPARETGEIKDGKPRAI